MRDTSGNFVMDPETSEIITEAEWHRRQQQAAPSPGESAKSGKRRAKAAEAIAESAPTESPKMEASP